MAQGLGYICMGGPALGGIFYYVSHYHNEFRIAEFADFFGRALFIITVSTRTVNHISDSPPPRHRIPYSSLCQLFSIQFVGYTWTCFIFGAIFILVLLPLHAVIPNISKYTHQ